MRAGTALKHEDELVLATIQTTHTGVVFDPNANILELAVGLGTRCVQLTDVPPVHANEMNRTIDTVVGQKSAGPGKKGGEFCGLNSPEAMAKSP